MLKILCVDDDADMRSLIALGLGVDGFAEVIEARDGWDAIEKCRLLWPDLILMDIMMPHLNGIEAIRRLRTMEAAHTVPIIVISAKYNHELMEHALSIGANEYVTKPFAIEDLKQTIQHYCGGSISFEQRERRRHQELARAAASLSDAQKMESLYRLAVWQRNPTLAANLDQLTELAGGIIHDLRNRLGILCNYNVRAKYCLWLLESLAFLCFQPSLSRQFCRGNLRRPEIQADDLTRFAPSGAIPLTFTRRNHRHHHAAVSGISLKGLFDQDLLRRTLWLLCHNLIAYYRNAPHEPSLQAIEIEDRRLLDSQFGLYIKISLRQAGGQRCPFPGKFDCDQVLAGERLAIALLLLRKAIFLHGGEMRFDDQGSIVIKIEDCLKPSWVEDASDGIQGKITRCLDDYTGPEPNIYPLVRKFIPPISRELDNIRAEARSNRGPSSNERAQAMIQRNCRYAHLLLQNLLWLGVGVELPREWVDVGDTLRSVQKILSSEMRTGDDDAIEVKVDVAPAVAEVWSNRVSLQQVFMNLIINALEAMPGGGHLWLRVFQQGQTVYAEVGDTGGGMSPAQINQAFDLAFSTKQGRERGTGLHIVKSIIDKWGGTIDVTSTLGQSTTFRICLHNLNAIPTKQPGEEYVTTPSRINC